MENDSERAAEESEQLGQVESRSSGVTVNEQQRRVGSLG